MKATLQMCDIEKRIEKLMGLSKFQEGYIVHLIYSHSLWLYMIQGKLSRGQEVAIKRLSDVSNFGLPKLIKGEETEGNTFRIAGSRGYMAPEYAIFETFSKKSNIYNFEIVLLEILNGRLKMRIYEMEHVPSLPAYAWKLWKEGKALVLMDEALGSSCNITQFLRCLHVGLLCVQEHARDRPTMSEVLSLLSENTSLPIPNQQPF
ncbi:hypothetical protein DITRI_Ditri18aG0046300 [Diplodiscus trichospermus]